MMRGYSERESIRVDKVRLSRVPAIDWQIGLSPEEVFELWFLRGGRRRGERMGWLARRATAWEFRMVPGVTPVGGFAATEHDALGEMLAAIGAA